MAMQPYAQSLPVERLDTKLGRRYSDGTITAPSVTTILDIIGKDGFMDWAVRTAVKAVVEHLHEEWDTQFAKTLKRSVLTDLQKMGIQAFNDVKSYHGEVGTYVHKAIEDNREPTDVIDALIETAWSSWKAFERDWNVNHDDILFEQLLLGRGPMGYYGGTLDCVWERPNGTRVLIDLKTTRMIYPVYSAQVAAYTRAWQQTYPDKPIDQIIILRLGKYFETYEVKEVNYEVGRNIFDSAHYIYNNLHDIVAYK